MAKLRLWMKGWHLIVVANFDSLLLNNRSGKVGTRAKLFVYAVKPQACMCESEVRSPGLGGLAI
jgi:hypothetical protein